MLKWQRVYARTDVKKQVESVMGGNVAIPRRTLERFGLWDECTPIEDEPSLAYRITAGKADDEYLLFDPNVTMIRRLDVPGGMAKRQMSGPRYAKRVFTFLHNIVGHYFPLRFVLLYPVYIYFVAYHCIEWICSDSKKHQTLPLRIWATTGMILSIIPLWLFWLAQWGRMAASRTARQSASTSSARCRSKSRSPRQSSRVITCPAPSDLVPNHAALARRARFVARRESRPGNRRSGTARCRRNPRRETRAGASA